jgi:hypothetical protein
MTVDQAPRPTAQARTGELGMKAKQPRRLQSTQQGGQDMFREMNPWESIYHRARLRKFQKTI